MSFNRKTRHEELAPEDLQVLYEDNHVIAVYKPPGILVQGDRSGDLPLLEVVKQYIRKKYEKPGEVFIGVVHRLDRPVSGVVLFARTSKAASRLSGQWRARTVRKTYWAVVHGTLQPEIGTLNSFLRKGRRKVKIGAGEDPVTQEARLSYRTLCTRNGFSLVEILLHTGRKHQIRVQLAAAGCPIAGDVKYGGTGKMRVLLEARSLTFVHPTRDEEVTVESPTPEWAGEFLTGFTPTESFRSPLPDY
jgi:23S rRNA pseudouridine1911/1915/1917 synthase